MLNALRCATARANVWLRFAGDREGRSLLAYSSRAASSAALASPKAHGRRVHPCAVLLRRASSCPARAIGRVSADQCGAVTCCRQFLASLVQMLAPTRLGKDQAPDAARACVGRADTNVQRRQHPFSRRRCGRCADGKCAGAVLTSSWQNGRCPRTVRRTRGKRRRSAGALSWSRTRPRWGRWVGDGGVGCPRGSA